MIIISNPTSKKLADEISAHLLTHTTESNMSEFANGETRINGINDSVRGETVYIILSVSHDINSDLIETMLLSDTCELSSTNRTVLVCPLYPYSRQDRKFKGRVPISAKTMAKLFRAVGVDHIITVDLHNPAIQAFPDKITMDNLTARQLFKEYVLQILYKPPEGVVPTDKDPHPGIYDDIVIVSPDAGGAERARDLSNDTGTEMIMIYKERLRANEVSTMKILGEDKVKDKKAVIYDDMADTCGTLCKAAEVLYASGAKEVTALITHGILSNDAIDKINASKLDRLVITNSMAHDYDAIRLRCPKIEVINISWLLSKAIKNHNKDKSMGPLFEKLDYDFQQVLMTSK